jgi:hypothetical protein
VPKGAKEAARSFKNQQPQTSVLSRVMFDSADVESAPLAAGPSVAAADGPPILMAGDRGVFRRKRRGLGAKRPARGSHPRPCLLLSPPRRRGSTGIWIPAFAGMTMTTMTRAAWIAIYRTLPNLDSRFRGNDSDGMDSHSQGSPSGARPAAQRLQGLECPLAVGVKARISQSHIEPCARRLRPAGSSLQYQTDLLPSSHCAATESPPAAGTSGHRRIDDPSEKV